MVKDKFLVSYRVMDHDDHHAAPGDDMNGPRRTGPGEGVSLFRPGNSTGPRGAAIELWTGRDIFGGPLAGGATGASRVWDSLNPFQPDAGRLIDEGLFVAAGAQTTPFDVLRTRLLQGLQDKGWRRIAITSPTHGCGKSFVAANLGFSLARRPGSRTVLVDLELRRPRLAALLGLRDAGALADVLRGDQPLESHFRRIGSTLALGLNAEPVAAAADLLHSPDTAATLDLLQTQLDPEVVVYDCPPALVGDDVIALAPLVDAVLLVTDGTRTSPEEIRACERLFADRIPLMGVVLNRAQDRKSLRYRYGRG